MPLYAEFPREEFEARWTKLRTEMSLRGMTALVATIEPNYRYLTGHHNQRWPNYVRPRCAILPIKGEPIILTIGSESWGIDEVTWVKDIRTFEGERTDDGYGLAFVKKIVATLRDLGISTTFDRIGIEMGGQMPMGMSYEDFQRFLRGVSPCEVIDSSEIWWEGTKIKSKLEIDCIREAAQITSKAFDQIIEDIRIGMTEQEVERRFNALQLEYGAERPTYVPVNFHRGRHPRENHIVFGLSTTKKLEPGMMIDMDAGCKVKGYWSDFNRTFSAGGPPMPEADRAYKILREAIDAAIGAVKPGRPLQDVARAQMKVFQASGIVEAFDLVGLLGHGLGLYSTSRPLVNLRDTTIMSEGLFFTIEPVATVKGYGMALQEENVVVTADGVEVLSKRAPREIPIVGGTSSLDSKARVRRATVS